MRTKAVAPQLTTYSVVDSKRDVIGGTMIAGPSKLGVCRQLRKGNPRAAMPC